MGNALIGFTGFVGSNLLNQYKFDRLYNSKNIDQIKGESFDTVYCAGVSAIKWLANKNPEQDLQEINDLICNLDTITTKKFVLISTVDVYPNPIDVDEDSPIDVNTLDAYGKHRLILENYVQKKFEAVIIRLPGLFGKGLKKNVIYDFIHNNCLEMIHQDGVFQFYNLDNLSKDIEMVIKNKISLINFATQSLSIQDLVNHVFYNNFKNKLERAAPFYDFRTKYAYLWNNEHYMYKREQILLDIKNFVDNSRVSI
jgi:nucleoside-diphosphate-sugar epimerase